MEGERRKRRFCAAFLLLQHKSRALTNYMNPLNDSYVAYFHFQTSKQNKVCRIEGYAEETVPRYLDTEFQEHFRLTRCSFELLVQRLGRCPVMVQARQQGGGTPITVEKQALMCCWYLGNLESFRSMSDRFGVPKSSVHKSCKRVVSCLTNEIMSEEVVWPTGDKLQHIVEEFAELTLLERGIVGAIDGSHIRIRAPKHQAASYINRKKFHSVVLQGICDSTLKFTHVYCGWPGCTHDARVLRNCSIFRHADVKFVNNTYLLGDSAYPLQNWLMTPFRDTGNLTRQQKRFNYQLSKARQTIERSFGLLKQRWRRLTQFDALDMKLLVNSVLAACCLHNICIGDGLFDDSVTDADDPNDNIIQAHPEDIGGVQRRQNMVHRL